MITSFIIEDKQFKTERGLMNHVAKMFPNASAVFKVDHVELFIHNVLAGKLNIKTVKLVGKQVQLVSGLQLV